MHFSEFGKRPLGNELARKQSAKTLISEKQTLHRPLFIGPGVEPFLHCPKQPDACRCRTDIERIQTNTVTCKIGKHSRKMENLWAPDGP